MQYFLRLSNSFCGCTEDYQPVPLAPALYCGCSAARKNASHSSFQPLQKVNLDDFLVDSQVDHFRYRQPPVNARTAARFSVLWRCEPNLPNTERNEAGNPVMAYRSPGAEQQRLCQPHNPYCFTAVEPVFQRTVNIIC